MEEITLEAGIRLALDAIVGDRLALLCGAGLSMAPPTRLPSAATLAAAAKQKYDATYGGTRDPLPVDIEGQAEFFFRSGQLATVYLNTYIDSHAFSGPPNTGHSAIADLILVGAIRSAVSTNVDSAIEMAGHMLRGRVAAVVDRHAAAIEAAGSSLMKLHGSWDTDRASTLWAPGQLSEEPTLSRLRGCKEWLSVALLNRDLLIVGFWTDWQYINAVLEQTIGAVSPSSVVVVDSSDGAWLAKKAPSLEELGKRAALRFKHVRESGNVFLERLRLEFSEVFVRRLLYCGAASFAGCHTATIAPAWKEPPPLSVTDFWHVRRDLEGVLPNDPARCKEPPDEPLLGLTLIELQARGAVADGRYWRLDGHRIRVIRAANKQLHEIEAAFACEAIPVGGPDFVVAVGAENVGLPTHVVRGSTAATIARGSAARWLTRPEAVREFALS